MDAGIKRGGGQRGRTDAEAKFGVTWKGEMSDGNRVMAR